MNFLTRLVISALAVILSSKILPGVAIDSALTGVVVALVLAILNAFVKPILVILTIPITIFTVGLFLLVINALMILLAGNLVEGFRVSGFWTALLFSIILSLITSLLTRLGKNEKQREG